MGRAAIHACALVLTAVFLAGFLTDAPMAQAQAPALDFEVPLAQPPCSVGPPPAGPIPNEFIISLSNTVPVEDRSRTIEQLIQQYDIEATVIFGERFIAVIPAADIVTTMRADARIGGVAQNFQFPIDELPRQSCPTPSPVPATPKS